MDLSAEVCGKFPFSACFLRPQGAILNYILSLAYSDSRYENDNLVMDGR